MKGLALLVGLFGVTWSVLAPVTLTLMASGYLPSRGFTERGLWVTAFVLIGTFAVAGIFMLRQVWRHWRQPDQATAKRIVGIASFVMGLWFFTVARKLTIISMARDWSQMTEIACGLGIVAISYLFYRFALRNLAEQAYPVAPEAAARNLRPET